MEAAGINRRLAINVTEDVKLRMKRYTSLVPDSNGCLIWVGAQRNGYGAIKIQQRVYSSHCVAFAVGVGAIEEGCVIAHKCDVKLCVNPEHLECVSITKNNQDAHKRRLRPVCTGNELPHAVLNESLVFQILDLHNPRVFGYRKIARQLGISEAAVKSLLFGKTWMKEREKYYSMKTQQLATNS